MKLGSVFSNSKDKFKWKILSVDFDRTVVIYAMRLPPVLKSIQKGKTNEWRHD